MPAVGYKAGGQLGSALVQIQLGGGSDRHFARSLGKGHMNLHLHLVMRYHRLRAGG